MRKHRSAQICTLMWSALLVFAVVVTRPAAATSPFDGNWVFKYSCDSATGLFAERCLRGEGDFFELFDLSQNGDRICGYHIVTAYGQNKVEEGDSGGGGPSVYGTVAGNTATVQFRSTWTGSIGVATITVDNALIVWHVVEPTNEQSWFPADAVLSRDTSDLSYRSTTCGAGPTNSGK